MLIAPGWSIPSPLSTELTHFIFRESEDELSLRARKAYLNMTVKYKVSYDLKMLQIIV